MDNQTIGQIICEHRKKKGLTQKALAEQLNITDKAVSKWERDIARPDINTVPQLAEILDVPVELLINIPLLPKEAPSIEPAVTPVDPVSQEGATATIPDPGELERQRYKEKAKKLLMKGIIGFAGGFLFAFVMATSDRDPFSFFFGCGIGILCAGIPYGYELLGKIIGQWFVVGHIGIMLIVFMLKLVGAVLISWATYPIALTYNLMKSQKPRSTGRRILTIALIVAILLVVAFLLLAIQPWA